MSGSEAGSRRGQSGALTVGRSKGERTNSASLFLWRQNMFLFWKIKCGEVLEWGPQGKPPRGLTARVQSHSTVVSASGRCHKPSHVGHKPAGRRARRGLANRTLALRTQPPGRRSDVNGEVTPWSRHASGGAWAVECVQSGPLTPASTAQGPWAPLPAGPGTSLTLGW